MRTKLSAFCDGVIEAGWLAAVVVVPLAVNIHTTRIYEPVKVALLRSVVAVMILAWLVRIVEEQGGGKRYQGVIDRARDWLQLPLVLPVLLYSASYVLSTLFSINPRESTWGSFERLQGTYTTLCYVALFGLTAGRLRTWQQIDRLVTAIILSSVPVAAYGIVQRLGLDPLATTANVGRVASTSGNAIFLASYLILVVPLTLSRLVTSLARSSRRHTVEGRRAVALLYGSAFAFQTTAILLTGSRGPVLGLVGAAFIAGAVALPRVRHWLWAPWLGAGVLAAALVVVTSVSGEKSSPFFGARHFGRLARISADVPTARVRTLIWDAATQLSVRAKPVGIPEDALAPPDPHHSLRRMVGYGPETSMEVLASVYPPGLAQLEGRRYRPDRSHNETIDAALTTGMLGVLAYYFLIMSLLTHGLELLGWVAESSRLRVYLALAIGGVLGVTAAVLLDRTGSPFTFVGLGLPTGVLAGMVAYVALQCARQRATVERRREPEGALSLAVFVGVVAHLLDVHFAFSTAATHTYFWVYAGLLVALSRLDLQSADTAHGESGPTPEDLRIGSTPQEGRGSERRSRKRKGALRVQKEAERKPTPAQSWFAEAAYLEAAGAGFVMALILATLLFDFFSPRAPMTNALASLFVIVWTCGLFLAVAMAPRVRAGSSRDVRWLRLGVAVSYSVASLGGSIVCGLMHRVQISSWRGVTAAADVVAAGAALADDVAVYVVCLSLLMTALAASVKWPRLMSLPSSRTRWLWVYILVALATGGVVWFKNVDVIRADVYLKEAERYREGGKHEEALALHEKARSLDADEEFYYLMLALAQQATADDARVEKSRRESALEEWGKVVLEARKMDPYKPDNVANVGRYYLHLGRRLDKRYLKDAVAFLRKAVALAPSDAVLQELLARSEHLRGDDQAAIKQLEVSVGMDPRYPPSWLLLGDCYLAKGQMSKALEAHARGMQAVDYGSEGFKGFVTEGFAGRVRSYASAGQLTNLVSAMQTATTNRPADGLVSWAIGRAYAMEGERAKALPYFEEAVPLLERAALEMPGDAETRTRLAQVYKALGRPEEALQALGGVGRGSRGAAALQFELGVELAEQGLYAQAAVAFEKVIETDEKNAAAHRNLGVMYYYHLGRKQEGLAQFKRALGLDPGTRQGQQIRRLIQQHRE